MKVQTKVGRVLLLVVVFCVFVNAKHLHHERYYQEQLCKALNGEMEVVLADGTRVDCLSDEYAIEVDFASKWAESVGQSLYYAKMTGKKPAIALIIEKPQEKRFVKRVKVLTQIYKITLFEINGF